MLAGGGGHARWHQRSDGPFVCGNQQLFCQWRLWAQGCIQVPEVAGQTAHGDKKRVFVCVGQGVYISIYKNRLCRPLLQGGMAAVIDNQRPVIDPVGDVSA